VSRLCVQTAPPEHWPWLLNRIDACVTPVFQALEAVDDSGRIHAMVGYDFWTPNSVQVSVALDTPGGARAVLRPAFTYPFVVHGRKVLWAAVSSSNTEALKLDLHLGFREVHRIQDGHSDGVDLILLEMRRDECRWVTQ
jgi:RimJ/RimL family protein N-acetyltransferase